MSQDIPYRDRWLYHFTHMDNLSAIVQNGLCCDNGLAETSYINSGNRDIKHRRKGMSINQEYTVGDFVPFYFAPRSPMLYTQWKNGLVVQADIIYLVTTIGTFLDGDTTFYFSNRNAATYAATFYNTEKDLCRVPWEHMQGDMWNNMEAYPDRMAQRMAEFLVYWHVPWTSILGIAVFDEDTYHRINQQCPHGKKIAVRRQWYY